MCYMNSSRILEYYSAIEKEQNLAIFNNAYVSVKYYT